MTKLVKPGTNVFAAIGHRAVTWSGNINAPTAFLLEARLSYPDGSSSIVGTDESWKVLDLTPRSSKPMQRILAVEGATARPSNLIAPGTRRGWEKVGFDDSNWASATVVNRSDYHLFAQMAPLEREQAELKPVRIASTNGVWLVDLGRCIDGWPKLTMQANHPGDVVRAEYFQMTDGRKPAGWDEYICRGGTETWDADFGRYTSFQVMKITGYAGKLKASDVRGMWAYCDADVAGHFHCSNDLLNDVYEMCERSARQNVQQGIIAVDAQREQLPWLADNVEHRKRPALQRPRYHDG